MNGEGEYSWPDGKIYKGNFTNDQRQDYGVLKWPDGK